MGLWCCFVFFVLCVVCGIVCWEGIYELREDAAEPSAGLLARFFRPMFCSSLVVRGASSPDRWCLRGSVVLMSYVGRPGGLRIGCCFPVLGGKKSYLKRHAKVIGACLTIRRCKGVRQLHAWLITTMEEESGVLMKDATTKHTGSTRYQRPHAYVRRIVFWPQALAAYHRT